jgi:hypothetical protein
MPKPNATPPKKHHPELKNPPRRVPASDDDGFNPGNHVGQQRQKHIDERGDTGERKGE